MRLLIVDDEPAARPEFAVLGAAGCRRTALRAAPTLHPDLILLDLQLPDTAGMEVLRVARRTAASLSAHPPAKPAGLARLLASIERASARAPAPAPGAQPRTQLLVGEREHRLYVLRPERVEFIEAHGNYVRLHAADAQYISRDSVKHLAQLLGGHGFVRIERSLLVNLQSVLYAQRAGRGTYTLTLVSGSRLHSGAGYREELLRALPLTPGSALRVMLPRPAALPAQKLKRRKASGPLMLMAKAPGKLPPVRDSEVRIEE